MEGLKYFIYCRKSSEDKDRQILSIDSQINALKELVQKSNSKIIKIFTESKSAKAPGREQFNLMLEKIEKKEAQGILCWKLDRLARNPVDEGKIKWMLQQGIIQKIKTPEREYNPGDNTLITSVEFGMANQYILDLKTSVKRGLQDKVKLGWRPGRAPVGYLNSKTKLKGAQDIIPDPKKFEIVKQIFQLMLTGNYRVSQLLEIANNKLGLMIEHKGSPRKVYLSEIYRILTNPFYYGYFKWHGELMPGKHEPMITIEEFDRIQAILGKNSNQRPKSHQFTFTGLMYCLNCGSAITAEEKIKHQKNGNIHHYIYYHCTRKKDPACTEKSIKIEDLNRQINKIIDHITIPEKLKNWAIESLREFHSNNIKSNINITEQKQKQLEQINQQINSLINKYISPENSDNQIISQEEYKSIKNNLIKDKNNIEGFLRDQDSPTPAWLELSERTFNFACYAKTWFANGDEKIRRAIFSALGSNLTVIDQKVFVSWLKPLNTIVQDISNLLDESNKLEPIKIPTNYNEFVSLFDKFPTTSG